jgi:Mg-chelatase subunit ChlD
MEVDPPEEVLTFGSDRFMQNGTVLRRTRGLSETWRWVHPDTKSWLVGLAHDPSAGQLYSLDLSRQELLSIDENGLNVVTRSLGTPGFQAYTDLDLASDGRLLLVNRTQKTLERRSNIGALESSWDIQGVPLRVAAAPGPTGGAFVLTREGWVWRLDASGQVIAWWDAAADAEGRRGIPSDLSVGPDGRVYITDAGANEVRAYAIDPRLSPPPPPSGEGCSFLRDKWASPTRLRLGESTAVTLTVSGTCFEEGQGADIILVVDRSGSMDGRKMETARAAAMAFVGEIDFQVSRVGLVVFSAGAEMPLGLSNDPGALVESIAGFDPPIGGTNIGAGLQMATTELTSTGRTSVERIIIVMTDGRPEGDVVDTDLAADQAKVEGIRIFSIGFGTDVDPGLMQRIATAPEDYFFAPGATELSRIYTEIARRITGGVIAETATITDVVPSNMQLMPETVRPAPASIQNKTITWELTGVREDIQLGYRVIPLEIGTWPTNVEAWYRYLDGLGIPGRLEFPVPMVIVEGPPEPIFLPIVGKPFCRPKRQHTDVALVLDTSSSMDGAKLAAAKDAGVRFVERLELPKDQAAVVDFNTEAHLIHGLSGDGKSLEAAIRALDWTPGTRVDEGLRLAVDELTGPRRRIENTSAIVLLTDGLNNEGPAPVLEMARRAADSGIIVYTIALGDDADRALMEQVAGDPARAFVAVGPADLDRIYGEIAGVIACP